MWKQKPNEASYDYTNSKGEVVANVRMVGIKGRWRWSCATYARVRIDKGWSGTKASYDGAKQAAEDFLREKNDL